MLDYTYLDPHIWCLKHSGLYCKVTTGFLSIGPSLLLGGRLEFNAVQNDRGHGVMQAPNSQGQVRLEEKIRLADQKSKPNGRKTEITCTPDSS